MKISKQKKQLLKIISNHESVESNYFYSIFIGRFPARLNEMKKQWDINYTFKNGTYHFDLESRRKAQELLEPDYVQGTQLSFIQ